MEPILRTTLIAVVESDMAKISLLQKYFSYERNPKYTARISFVLVDH